MNTNSKEVWRTIPTSRGRYQASNLGRVRSLHGAFPRVLKPATLAGGTKAFSMAINGRKYSITVARAVAEAFLGLPEDRTLEARHRSYDNTDNSLENVYWGPRSDQFQARKKSA